MTNLLIKFFVKNPEDVHNPKVRESYGKFAGVIGIITNVVLASIKMFLGLLSSSIAIIADGVNNLADASSSVITLVGFKLAGMPEDEDHPYGHARIEYLTGIFISIGIILIGILLLKSSVEKILNPTAVEFSYLTIALLVIAIFFKLWQMHFYKVISKKISSLALMATCTDSRNDVISTSTVLLSVIVGKFSGVNLDGIFGALVAVFIVWSGIQLIKETSSPLLGEAPDRDLINSIKKIVNGYDQVIGIHDLVVHNYGPGKIFASIHIEVDGDKDLMESHDIIDLIERKIYSDLHIECTGHMDPVKINDPIVKELTALVSQVIDGLEGVSDMHDLRVVPGNTHTNVIFDVILAHNAPLSKKEIHHAVESVIKEYNSNFFVVITFDKKYL